VEWLDAVLSGGVKVVQLRLKDASRDDLLARAALFGAMCREAGALSIINDHADVALVTGCDGVHLGPADSGIAEARSSAEAWERRDLIIGASARAPERARDLEAADADYIGCGACFPTDTKIDTEYIGLDGLKAVCAAVSIPVVGIGGIGWDNWEAVMESGAKGFAAISMWNLSPGEIRAKLDALMAARRGRGERD
jgi:thiamine-phosphate diphosphorylase